MHDWRATFYIQVLERAYLQVIEANEPLTFA
jgi:hypothetical protein